MTSWRVSGYSNDSAASVLGNRPPHWLARPPPLRYIFECRANPSRLN
jgi:hypothetical protein